MKLVIEVKEEDYKRYKEDKILGGSYTNAVLDAVPLNEVLDEAIGQYKDELFNYANESIAAEKRAMNDYHYYLTGEDYHKGIIYAFERIKMKLM